MPNSAGSLLTNRPLRLKPGPEISLVPANSLRGKRRNESPTSGKARKRKELSHSSSNGGLRRPSGKPRTNPSLGPCEKSTSIDVSGLQLVVFIRRTLDGALLSVATSRPSWFERLLAGKTG